MHQSITRRPVRPATIADFHRLANLAEARGIELIIDAQGRNFATSASNPFALHYVTGLSCTCAGFQSHQRCSHHALLLRRLGWLPELEPALESALEPALPSVADDVETVTCRSCTAGRVEEWASGHVIGCRPCDVCAGSGRVPALPAAPPQRIAA